MLMQVSCNIKNTLKLCIYIYIYVGGNAKENEISNYDVITIKLNFIKKNSSNAIKSWKMHAN